MRSTGEGIAIAETKEEALAKVFSFLGKGIKEQQNEVFLAESVELPDEIEHSMHSKGLKPVKGGSLEEWLKDKKGKVVLSSTEKEKTERLKAAKYRLHTFTSLETFEAYIEGSDVADLTVTSLSEWQSKLKKGVLTI